MVIVAFGSAASDAKNALGCAEVEEADDETAARAAAAAVAPDVVSASGGTKLEHACEHACPPVAMIALR